MAGIVYFLKYHIVMQCIVILSNLTFKKLHAMLTMAPLDVCLSKNIRVIVIFLFEIWRFSNWGFLIMKTTFSHFLGLFENSALAEYYLKKSKILWNINYLRIRRKIIDDYCLSYLNDLFGNKLIILRSELNVANFWICMDATFFGMSSF